LRDLFGLTRFGSVHASPQLGLESLPLALPGNHELKPRSLPSELRDLDGEELLDALREHPEPFFMKTHRLSDRTDPAPAIYVVRDGRDALVSYAHWAEDRDIPRFRGRSFTGRLEMLLDDPPPEQGDWSQHVRGWTHRGPPTALLRYEDLVENPREAVGSILRALGVEVPEPAGTLRPFSELQREDPTVYRRGRIGAFRDEMPASIEERFWRLHGTEMEALGYSRSGPADQQELPGPEWDEERSSPGREVVRRPRGPAGERIARLQRELKAVDTERLRLRAELEQIRRSPVGPLIDPARTLGSIVDRYVRRLRDRVGGGQTGLLRRARRRPATGGRRAAPRLSGSELIWLARHRLQRPATDWSSAAPPTTSREWLTPILVDSFGRDGSTLMMALLATSPQIAIDEKYPYERHYFAYLWRWSRLLSETDWPGALWAKSDVDSISHEQSSALVGPPPWLPRELLEPGPDGTPISRRCFELAWSELSLRAVERARSLSANGVTPRYYAEKHSNTWLVDTRELPPMKLIALLRDPRDTYASIRAFEDKESATSFSGHHAWTGTDPLGGIIQRQRQRLRWIARLLDEGRVPVIRYMELTEDLPGVVRRLEEHLEVELSPEDLRADELLVRHGSSTTDGSRSGRPQIDPKTAERFTRELNPELQAVGLDP
jgi:hypothetical protein